MNEFRQHLLPNSRYNNTIGLFFLVVIILTILPIFSYGAEESITVTTYYPSPYGVYSEMRLYPKLESEATACDSSQEGLMYYDKDKHTLKVCGKAGKWENQAPRFFKGLGCASCPYGTQSFNLGLYVMTYCKPKDYDGTVLSFDAPPEGGYACHSDYLSGDDIHFLFLSY